DYDRLLPLAREHEWILIADAAHSIGGALGSRPVGALADMTTLSFHPAKQMTTGEGGAVLTDREDLAERLRTMRHHGIRHPDPARREHRRDAPLPARLPAPVLSGAVQVRPRALPGRGGRRGAPDHPAALPEDEPR